MAKRFNKRYITGDLPWNINRPDFNLVQVVNSFSIKPDKALDIGCGTGDNAMWLTQQGFNTTGVDVSEKAIEMAQKKAVKNDIGTSFFKVDFLKEPVPGYPFKLIFDRGCFHSFDKKKEKQLYAKNVHTILDDEGFWLTLTGNYDDGRLDVGPPKLKALDITNTVEAYFEIISLTQGRFDSNDEVPSKIWICLMKKRRVE